jgi:hypothetical protein
MTVPDDRFAERHQRSCHHNVLCHHSKSVIGFAVITFGVIALSAF